MKKLKKCNKILLSFLEILLLLIMLINITRFSSLFLVKGLKINNSILSKLTSGINIAATMPNLQKNEGFIEKYENLVKFATQMINEICTTSSPFANKANIITDIYNKNFIHCNLKKNAGYYGRLETGVKAAFCTNDFMQHLEDCGIKYVFIQTPYIETYRKYNNKVNEIDNWNSVYGREAYVKNIDFNKNFVDLYYEFPNNYEWKWDVTNHWVVKNALDTSKYAIDYINEKYNINLSSNLLNRNLYLNILNDEFMSKIKEKHGYDFEYYSPITQENKYEVKIKDEKWEGTWDDCFINENKKWDIEGHAFHGISRIVNNSIYHIENKNNNNGLRLMIIGDSYCWPIYAYYSQLFQYVDAIWCGNHNKMSFYKYIDSYKPDISITILNDCQFTEKDAPYNFNH